jgi:SM-20-related protein
LIDASKWLILPPRTRHYSPRGLWNEMMSYLDYDALEQTPLSRDPYDFIVIENFILKDEFPKISADFPKVPGPGSHPPSELDIHGHFAAVMREMDGPVFKYAIERKVGVDLTDRPTMYTVRGFTREKDGEIHTDTKMKIITVLLYMNEGWEPGGGRLRILRSGTDLEDYVVEAPPNCGTLLVFRRSETSWHGHKPFSGPRRTIQMNWVTDQSVVDREQSRHRLSTRVKKVAALFGA